MRQMAISLGVKLSKYGRLNVEIDLQLFTTRNTASQKAATQRKKPLWCTLTKEIQFASQGKRKCYRNVRKSTFFFSPSENTTIKKDENFRQEEKNSHRRCSDQGRWMSMLKRQILNNLHSYRSTLHNMFCYLYRLRYKISPPSLSFCKIYSTQTMQFLTLLVFILVIGPCHLFHLQIKYSLCSSRRLLSEPSTPEQRSISRSKDIKSHSFSNWDKDSHIIRPGQ